MQTAGGIVLAFTAAEYRRGVNRRLFDNVEPDGLP